jgi:hypothetical protein
MLVELMGGSGPHRYEIYYKQMVGTEDVFLGTSDKTPGSNDCTHIVVKVRVTTHKIRCMHLFIYHKQMVGTEDVFLGTSDKTPGSLRLHPHRRQGVDACVKVGKASRR